MNAINDAQSTNAEPRVFQPIQEPISKREYFAAMVKVPDEIIQMEIEMWRGDKNRLPSPNYPDFHKMMEAVANLEATYQVLKADALLNQLKDTK